MYTPVQNLDRLAPLVFSKNRPIFVLNRKRKYLTPKWQNKYIYGDNEQLKTRNIIKADGLEINQNFDRNGNIIGWSVLEFSVK